MQGNVMIKVARLAGCLTAHPQYIAPYLSNYLSPKSPIDLEVPWFSYSAIRLLDQLTKPDMLVYEYGSGGSTFYFSRRCAHVVSIEDNPQWYNRVRRALHQRNITNVDLKLVPVNLTSIEGFRASGYAESLPKEQADIIVVDGSELTVQVRPVCFDVAESCIKSGGLIILDDSWRYTELRRRNCAKKVQTYQSVGPARPGVTSTDVFFY